MAKTKTVRNSNSVADYLRNIPDEKKRDDCAAIVDIINKQTGLEPVMWGSGIIGFGNYHYKYESGHEGDAPLTGIAARSGAITLYLIPDFEKKGELLQEFGKHKAGKGCIYIRQLEDINIEILKVLITNSVEHIRRLYPS